MLALPEGDEFQQFEPAGGIALVQVTGLPGDRVQVAITGTDAAPTADVNTTSTGLTLSLTHKWFGLNGPIGAELILEQLYQFFGKRIRLAGKPKYRVTLSQESTFCNRSSLNWCSGLNNTRKASKITPIQARAAPAARVK